MRFNNPAETPYDDDDDDLGSFSDDDSESDERDVEDNSKPKGYGESKMSVNAIWVR